MNTTVRDLVVRNRSCRRFEENTPVERKMLEELVDLARLSPSAANLQPLKYILSCETEMNARIFPHLAWAGYLKDWPGPSQGERPAAYIVILGDTRISRSIDCDHGIAAQSILLGAVEKGLAGCIIGLIRKEELRKALEIPSSYNILLVVVLGKPREKIVIENVGAEDDIQYYRDDAGIHHVPKRSLDDVILR